MIPLEDSYLDEEALRESRAAIDALTRCTQANLGAERGELVLRSTSEQEIENYWCRRFKSLIREACDALTHVK